MICKSMSGFELIQEAVKQARAGNQECLIWPKHCLPNGYGEGKFKAIGT